jgi:hypothetical protein
VKTDRNGLSLDGTGAADEDLKSAIRDLQQQFGPDTVGMIITAARGRGELI